MARRTSLEAVRSAALWGSVFAIFVAASALGYVASYKTQAERDLLAKTFGTNVGINAIIGPAHQIQTVPGFTAWRSLGVLGVVGAVWGLLLATKLLRGEEEGGRWELLLSGQTTRARASAQALVGLATGLVVLWLIPAATTVAVGQYHEVGIQAGSALYFALALVSGAAVFLALGTLASQLAPTRRQAATYAGVALGVSYALRMAADSGAGLQWLRWTTPLGWVEELQPLTGPQPLALVPIAGLVLVASLLAVHLAGRRDLTASAIPDRPRSRPRLGLLGSTTGLTVRLIEPVALGWMVGLALAGLMMGLIAKSAGTALASTQSFQRLVARLGAQGGGAAAYLGVAFLIGAVLVGLIATGQVSALRGEEAGGRLDQLLVRPVSRTSWLVGRLAVTLAVLVAAGAVTGLATWVGAVTQGTGIGIQRMMAAGLNLVPPAVFILGVATLVFGIRPRAAPLVAYAVLAWSFLIQLIGGIVKANHWLLDTSVFHHMAPTPAVDPNWGTNGIMVGIGLLAAVVGGAAFRWRDVTGE